MIDHLIHLYQRGSKPFRSLSALPDEQALASMRALYRPGSVYWERFADPAGYLAERRQTERWLRQEFIAKGGRPQVEHPIYMVYGRSQWMTRALDAVTLATTVEIEAPLALFTAADVSFTYPDSMVSVMVAREQNPAYYLPELHGHVFTLEEITALVAQYGLPADTIGAGLPPHLANYVEAQVWNWEPLRQYLRTIRKETA